MTRARTLTSRVRSSIMSKEPPAENAVPSPRMTTERTSSSRSTAAQMSARSRCICAPTAFSRGASSTICSTPEPSISQRRLGKSAYRSVIRPLTFPGWSRDGPRALPQIV